MSSIRSERWGSRLGIILAVAGNAIGLGNFLRFPRLAAEYGGGSFLIPYFISLIVLGIPLIWLEWTMGRYGGAHGLHSTPTMFGRLTRSRWGVLFGSLGVSLPLLFAIFYTYIESWTLAYAVFTSTGKYMAAEIDDRQGELPPEVTGISRRELIALIEKNDIAMKAQGSPLLLSIQSASLQSTLSPLDSDGNGELTTDELDAVLKPLNRLHTYRFLGEYQGVIEDDKRTYFATLATAIIFWLVTVALNVFVLLNGIRGGIENLARIAMPLLFLFAIILVMSVLMYGTPNSQIPTRSVWEGFRYVWQPNFNALFDGTTWLMAAGQIFFTLSIGTGSIQTYASYAGRDDDCVGAGLATVATNEFAEVALGASIAIPISVASFGLLSTQSIAAGGSYDLGFVAMPMIFEQMPLGRVMGTLWFALLFFAGITSSVGLCQPMMAFLQEAFGWSRRQSAWICGGLLLGFGLPIIIFFKHGYLDEYDHWVGTVGLILFAIVETIVFAWVFGNKEFRAEMFRSQRFRIPEPFFPVIRYVVPLSLAAMLIAWFIQESDVVFLRNASSDDWLWLVVARLSIVSIIVSLGLAALVSKSARRSTEGNN